MRRYAEPVEVRRGVLGQDREGPAQFLWRGRLWKVRSVLAHWVETGPWWSSATARTVIGSATGQEPDPTRPTSLGDLLTERELWRVEAGRGIPGPDGEADGGGVFDLSFDWAEGRWTLVGCTD